MSTAERRPHRLRQCPVKGCDWVQVTSWWITPVLTQSVDPKTLERDALDHLLTHSAPLKTIIT